MSQGSFREGPLQRDRRDHGHVDEDWYLYRGTCTSGHWNIAPVRMAGIPGQDNDAEARHYPHRKVQQVR